jgi:hypothetical protein
MEQRIEIEDFVIAMKALGCKVRMQINAPTYAVMVVTGPQGEIEASFYDGLLRRFWIDGHSEKDLAKAQEALLGRFWQNRLTTTVVMTRVLKTIGLTNRRTAEKYAKDFSISGLYRRKERYCTYATFYSREAETLVAERAEQLNRIAALAGHFFAVRVKALADGREYTTMSNSVLV